MVDRSDLHAGRPGLSAFPDRGLYRSPCFSASIRRASRSGGYAPFGTGGTQSMARISCLNIDYRLWRICPRLCRGRDVSRARAAAKNTRAAIDFLSSAATANPVLRHDAAALDWIHTLYGGFDQRIFDR